MPTVIYTAQSPGWFYYSIAQHQQIDRHYTITRLTAHFTILLHSFSSMIDIIQSPGWLPTLQFYCTTLTEWKAIYIHQLECLHCCSIQQCQLIVIYIAQLPGWLYYSIVLHWEYDSQCIITWLTAHFGILLDSTSRMIDNIQSPDWLPTLLFCCKEPTEW